MICPECGAVFERTPKMANNRKYCSFTCYRRLNDRKRDFRRDHRAARRAYKINLAREWRVARKAEGVCSRCGRNKADEGLLTCSECREYMSLSRTSVSNGHTKADYYKLWKEDNGDN